jgi:hypothetical protein
LKTHRGTTFKQWRNEIDPVFAIGGLTISIQEDHQPWILWHQIGDERDGSFDNLLGHIGTDVVLAADRAINAAQITSCRDVDPNPSDRTGQQ